jgi:hypothetical protein
MKLRSVATTCGLTLIVAMPFQAQVHLSRNGKQLVTARCVAGADGQVIDLDGPPAKDG